MTRRRRASLRIVPSTRKPSRKVLQVALAGDAVRLVARDLGDLHPGAGDPQVDQRLDLEAGHVERDERQAARPEGVVAVAEVGEVGAVQEVGGAAEARCCRALRSGVMSALPPPSRKREPLAKSAPASSASTKRGISAGSAEPSASSMTTRLPVTAAKPVRKASPLPRPLWVRTRIVGIGPAGRLDRFVRASCRRPGSPRAGPREAGSARWPMFCASFIAGTTTLTSVLRFCATVGARVGDRVAGGERLDVDQGHAADLARRRRRRLEQVERTGEEADRHADRLEGADEVEQALVVGVPARDHDAVGVVAVDDLQRRDAVGAPATSLLRRAGPWRQRWRRRAAARRLSAALRSPRRRPVPSARRGRGAAGAAR